VQYVVPGFFPEQSLRASTSPGLVFGAQFFKLKYGELMFTWPKFDVHNTEVDNAKVLIKRKFKSCTMQK